MLPLISCNRDRGGRLITDPAADTVLTLVDTGLYRTDYGGRPGLLIFSAHSTRMSVAYDTSMGGVTLAWKGPVQGLRSGLAGVTYFLQDTGKVWSVRRGGDTVAPAVRCLGISTIQGVLEVRLALILPAGDTILVQEFLNHDDHYGDHALETEIRFTGVDSGTSVVLRLDGKPAVGPWPVLWSASVGRLEGAPGREEYVQDFDGVGQVKGTFTGSYDP